MVKNRPETTKKPQITAKRAKKQAKTPEADRERARSYYAANRDKVRARISSNYEAMTPAERTLRRWKSQARPSPPKDGGKSPSTRRRAWMARAFCEWSDTEEVVRIYMACAIVNELGWGKYRVDHVVPLSSRLVCGLHTHTNLAVISHHENEVKGNHIWPGMAEISWETIDLLMMHP